jgi:predicted phage terminase large subunit-like protein
MTLNLDAWADSYVRTLYILARTDFALFRQLIHLELHWNWWTDEVARELNRFYRDLKEGRRPKLALMAPPQHGKTSTVLDFIAWIIGKHPELKTIFASYSDELGTTIMTRWHVDDVLGRMLERFGDELVVLRYPALAETTSWRWCKVLIVGDDGRCRFEWQKQLVRKGEALFPEHKPLSFLEERRKVMNQSSWEALYQQHPVVVGGGLIPIDKIKCRAQWDRTGIKRTVRYIDKAGTADGGAYTAMVLMHAMYDKSFVISHVVRGQWSALEREQKIKIYAEADRTLYRHGYKVVIEQEPGSGGKESAENTIRNLAGFNVVADKVTGAKEVRAEPFTAQVQAGNVYYVAGGWIHDFLTEAEAWPHGRYRDQIDAAAGAFAWLIKEPGYDRTYRAFQPGFVDEDL